MTCCTRRSGCGGVPRWPTCRPAPFAAAQAARLEDLRTAAAEDRAEVLLARGDHRDAVPDLRRLCAAHPLRERARGLLMRALHGDGRQAEALGVYEEDAGCWRRNSAPTRRRTWSRSTGRSCAPARSPGRRPRRPPS
ncbi:BTAD domain-containing putative transcriptional regulator [Actinomadura sp. KC345]|uniref:AfsR/SARP family transcriptional regulator n=1 Tax=Actinomadura sp. KC345 TaxID=2530371 RepID=UPI001FB77031|nr:BTAD domain-containing putative transcriptional regulator [Actinomadura sp. KC345]